MTIDDLRRPDLGIPHSMQIADRAPTERYYDHEFFRLEVEHLWSRTWQMACRLEEIPEVNDFTVYSILDRAVIVVRTGEREVVAFENSCRHRGVAIVEEPGNCAKGFVCPFHGWCYDTAGKNTAITRPRTFSDHNKQAGGTDLTPVRTEVWGGCAWINFDNDAPALRECIEPFASIMEAWNVDSYRVEWWRAIRLPINWKIAEEAFLEQYHVLESHPQLRIPERMPPRDPAAFDPKVFIEGELKYLRTMSEGMAGMVHATDVAIAESLRGMELPADANEARVVWERTLNDAVHQWHRERGTDVPDLNDLQARGLGDSMAYCFPHFFMLPMYSSTSSYRFRPLGPEETLMEIWSLTRYPEGTERPKPTPPEVWNFDDPRVPPIPAQDFSNLPKQQRGLHNRGLQFMRLSQGIEGGVANFERLVDGFAADLPYDTLLPALREINLNPLERPILDLGF